MNELELLGRFRAQAPAPDDLWLRDLRARLAGTTADVSPSDFGGTRRLNRTLKRRVALGAAAAVVTTLVVAGSVFLPTAPREAIARIDPEVVAVLHRLARIARETPAMHSPAAGQYVYTKSVETGTRLFLPGPGLEPFAYEVSSTSERWHGVDGSLRDVIQMGRPQFLTSADRKAYEAFLGTDAARHWGEFDWGKTWEEPMPPGSVGAPGDLDAGWEIGMLPTEPDELLALIEAREIFGGPATDWQTFDTATELLNNPSAPPGLRAAILEVMSMLPGTTLIGHTQDGLGRPGVAIGYSHGGVRRELVLDEQNGTILASRDVTIVGNPDVGLGSPSEMNNHCCTELAWPGTEAGTILFAATHVVFGEVVDSIRDRPDGSS